MTILVPVDGTDRGLAALRTAVDLADRLDAELDVVHVTDSRSEEDWNLLDVVNEVLEACDGDAEPRILIEDDAEGAGVSTAAGERIVEALSNGDYEFVVMGRHDGRGVLDTALLGSASEVVLEDSDVPVMLV